MQAFLVRHQDRILGRRLSRAQERSESCEKANRAASVESLCLLETLDKSSTEIGIWLCFYLLRNIDRPDSLVFY